MEPTPDVLYALLFGLLLGGVLTKMLLGSCSRLRRLPNAPEVDEGDGIGARSQASSYLWVRVRLGRGRFCHLAMTDRECLHLMERSTKQGADLAGPELPLGL